MANDIQLRVDAMGADIGASSAAGCVDVKLSGVVLGELVDAVKAEVKTEDLVVEWGETDLLLAIGQDEAMAQFGLIPE